MTAVSSLEGAVEEAVETEIILDRERLVRHLKRLHAATGEVVLSGPFMAAVENHDLCVMTGGLHDVEPLPHPIGIGSLDKLVGALGCLQSDQVEVSVKNGELVCAAPDRRVRIRTHEPDLRAGGGGQMDPATKQNIVNMFADADWQPFRPEVAKGVVQAISGLGEAHAEVAFRVGREGMTIIVYLLSIDFHRAEFDVAEVTAEDSFTLLLKGDQVRSIFSQIGPSLPVIALLGSKQVIGVRFQDEDNSVEVMYAISALEQGPKGRRSRTLPHPAPPSPEPQETNVAP